MSGVITTADRIAQPVGQVLQDYVLTPYAPRAPLAGRLHSVSLLRHFLRARGLLDGVWPIVMRLREHLGDGQTVWGVKRDAAGRFGVELYFYNHCRNAPGSPMAVSRLAGVLRELIDIPDALDESLPYLMCSLELDAERLAARRSEGFRIYLPGVRTADGHDGISYIVSREGLIRENRYSFYQAATELPAVQARMATSLHGAADREALLPALFSRCYTICYAEKRTADALYFSRITTRQLRTFVRTYMPGPLSEALQAHRAEFAHLCWDVGYDFQRRPTASQSRIVKAGLYGFV